ncbi:Ff.00g076290.m01.CDS01 [Fusarium sp. VM40]|nr:Ff.00g076290.m01.CDS01 [Fusarium sp. VM40]
MGTPLSSALSSLSDSDSDTEAPKDNVTSNDINNQANNVEEIEWLATTRERRSTAGNRMKSMLANEEPDSDLELLFAEDENDQGFSDPEVNGSDVQMDSSDDEDDNNNNDDDLEGEKELEKQAKERRAAQRKRKAQEAIPAKFRKKVRIDPTTRTPSALTRPEPRPKKKSERTSWLPSVADLPTRASSRQTTRLSKEQLHQQMVEREARRIKQLAQMQKKAAKLEAMKKPPMTQEERLREAGIVEKRNSKSLNRWEEAEKQREEERRAKLAALHNRTLKGPVITFWSGIGEWMGRHMVIEEPAKEKRKRGEKAKGKDKGQDVDKVPTTEDKKEDGQGDATIAGEAASKAKHEQQPSQSQPPTTTTTDPAVLSEPRVAHEVTPSETNKDGSKPAGTLSVARNGAPPAVLKAEDARPSTAIPPPSNPPPTVSNGLAAPAPPPPSSVTSPNPPSSISAPGGLTAPSPSSPTPNPTPTGPASTTSFMAAPPGLSRPSDSKPSGVLAAPILAPPPGIGIDGAAPSMMGFGNPKSNVLAPPNTSQGVMPPTLSTTTPLHNTPSAPSTSTSQLDPSTLAMPASSTAKLQLVSNPPAPPASSIIPGTLAVSQALNTQPQPSTGARNAIIFQAFDDNALKDRTVQTQIIFGRKMSRLSKPSPAPLCVITNHPARYRDPRTGLPYYNAYAYREIQRLTRGEYRWSHIIGAWVGSGTFAARGVPERFLNPDKKGPEKKAIPSEPDNGKEANKPPEQIHGSKPEISGDSTHSEKPAGAKPGFLATPKSESNKAAQPNVVPPVVVEPTNTANTVVMAPVSTPTPEPKSQAAADLVPTTTGNPTTQIQPTQ